MTQINRVCAYICASVVLGASFLAVMESILRKVFLSPTVWTLNLSTAVFIWAAWLGASWSLQELGHVSIDMLRNIIDKHTKGEKRMPRRIISVIGYLITGGVISGFLYGGIIICRRAIDNSILAPYAFKFPVIISYSAIVFGTILMLVTLVFIILDLIAGGDKYL